MGPLEGNNAWIGGSLTNRCLRKLSKQNLLGYIRSGRTTGIITFLYAREWVCTRCTFNVTPWQRSNTMLVKVHAWRPMQAILVYGSPGFWLAMHHLGAFMPLFSWPWQWLVLYSKMGVSTWFHGSRERILYGFDSSPFYCLELVTLLSVILASTFVVW